MHTYAHTDTCTHTHIRRTTTTKLRKRRGRRKSRWTGVSARCHLKHAKAQTNLCMCMNRTISRLFSICKGGACT